MIPSFEALRWIQPGTWARLTRPALYCQADRIPLAAHPRCGACGVLLGWAHSDPASSDGLCRSCR